MNQRKALLAKLDCMRDMLGYVIKDFSDDPTTLHSLSGVYTAIDAIDRERARVALFIHENDRLGGA